jgi:hypothetical protein
MNIYIFSENQEILRAMSHSEAIDTQSACDDDLLQMENWINKDDQDLHSVFIESGLFDRTDKLDFDEEQVMVENDQPEDDYDVDDLLKDALSS